MRGNGTPRAVAAACIAAWSEKPEAASTVCVAPPAPSAPPPHEWGGVGRRLRAVASSSTGSLPIGAKTGFTQPLHRLRRHLPINGEELLPMNGEQLAGGQPGAWSL